MHINDVCGRIELYWWMDEWMEKNVINTVMHGVGIASRPHHRRTSMPNAPHASVLARRRLVSSQADADLLPLELREDVSTISALALGLTSIILRVPVRGPQRRVRVMLVTR